MREERVAVLEKRVNELARSRGSEGGLRQSCYAFCSEKQLGREASPEEAAPSARELSLSNKI